MLVSTLPLEVLILNKAKEEGVCSSQHLPGSSKVRSVQLISSFLVVNLRLRETQQGWCVLHIHTYYVIVKKALPHSLPYLIYYFFISISIVIILSGLSIRKFRLRCLNVLHQSTRPLAQSWKSFQELFGDLSSSLPGHPFSPLSCQHSFWPVHRPALQQELPATMEK